ncbi:MAG: glycosyltransferase family 1 protein [Chthoniobacterales bacterium]
MDLTLETMTIRPTGTTTPMVLLIGNYAADQQQSMQRFSSMMLQGLTASGVPAELIRPEPWLGNFRFAGGFAAKWLGYLDKFVLFPRRLRARIRARRPSVIHICDHSNAMYVQQAGATPVVVTCHDLLAVRGGLGEETDTPASATGRILQSWILRSLQKADSIACVSEATRRDLDRLIPSSKARGRVEVIPLGLSYPFRPLPSGETAARLKVVAELELDPPYVLHVGSNLRRKNREGVLRIFARAQRDWPGQLVFAGEPLSSALREQAEGLGISGRIIEVHAPSGELLEALYNAAGAFLFPSRFEGFGWPIIEAQACGCPVLSSAREPMADVVGLGGLLRDPEDDEGFAQDLIRLADKTERARWRGKALENAERFTTERMISAYKEVYRAVSSAR